MSNFVVRDQARPRRAHFAAIGIGLIVLLNLAVTSASATINTAMLDNGTCGHNMQLGWDPTASQNNLPWFLLTGDGAGSVYTLKVDSVTFGTFTANAAGNVCANVTTALPDGAHQLTGTESSPHSGAITPFNFSVDTVRPLVPSAPLLSPSTNSGDPNDNVTSFRQVLMTGTATPGVQVVLKNTMVNPQAVIGTGMTDADGHYAITTIQLNGGIVRVIAWPVDGAGNTSVVGSNAFIMIVDWTAPVAPTPTLDPASDTEPIGDNTTTIATPVIRGNGEGTLTIALSVDGVPVGTTISDYNGNWSYTLPTQSTGTHAIRAGATDVAGNVGPISNPLSLTIGQAVTATVPSAPTLVSATPDHTIVTLAWTAPASNGGSPITGYTATASPGGAICTSAGLGCTVGGLANGTSYSFTVTATNAVGTGAASNALSATPRTVPGAPTLTSATPGNGQRRAGLDRARPPTAARRSPATPRPPARAARPARRAGLGCTVSGLTNGTTYSFTVTATNAAGTGPASNALSATPVAAGHRARRTDPHLGHAPATPASPWPGPPPPPTAARRSPATRSTAARPAAPSSCTPRPPPDRLHRRSAVNGTPTTTGQRRQHGRHGRRLERAVGHPARPSPARRPSSRPPPATRSVALAWTAPASNGGAPITGYTATASPGGATCTSAAPRLHGQRPDQRDRLLVHRDRGQRAPAPVPPRTPVGHAGRPGHRARRPDLTAPRAGNGQVALAWSAPASNGGSPITGYTATASPGGATCSSTRPRLHRRWPHQRHQLLVHRHRHQRGRHRRRLERPVSATPRRPCPAPRRLTSATRRQRPASAWPGPRPPRTAARRSPATPPPPAPAARPARARASAARSAASPTAPATRSR